MFLVLDAVDNFCRETAQIWQLVGNVVKIIQIAIPVLLVLWGCLDLGKAVVAGEEKEIKEAQSMLVKRIIYGVVVFFVVLIVKGLFSFIGGESAINAQCFQCVANPDKCVVSK